MDLMVLTYLEYLVLGVAVTAWVAETFARSGRVLLVDARPDQTALARSRVHLMKVGFYLLGLGYVANSLPYPGNPSAVRQSIEILADKVGAAFLALGLLLLFHLYALHRMRRRDLLTSGLPPVVPDGQTSLAAG